MEFKYNDYSLLCITSPSNRKLIFSSINTLEVTNKNLYSLEYMNRHKNIFCWGNNIGQIYLVDFIECIKCDMFVNINVNGVDNNKLKIEFF